MIIQKFINHIVLILLVLYITETNAQSTILALTSAEKKIVVDSIGSKLNANYIFPEVATKMANHLQKKFKNGDYEKVYNPQEFATTLTNDLVSISNDRHIRVQYDPEQIAAQQRVVTAEDSLAYLNRYIAGLKRNNFGFKEVKMLGGNVGYLDLRSFSDVTYAGETAVAAMNFLSSADAIIIDLRNNGGGSPAMIQLISSYLFGEQPVHLNNFYWRPNDSNTQTWTLPHVSGTRSPDTPVYVLTSGSTFSAAEEFSYNLKNLERATLVGQTTGGGAHPGGPVNATDQFTVWVPTGRAINPITNTNWEGTGVSPHIEIDANKALDIAHLEALKTLIKEHKETENSSFYEWPLAQLKIKTSPVDVDEKTLQSYAGNYGPRKITFENGSLYYQRDKGTKYKLIPYKNNEFILDGLDSFRIRLVSKNNKVTALEGLYDNGRTDKNLKS